MFEKNLRQKESLKMFGRLLSIILWNLHSFRLQLHFQYNYNLFYKLKFCLAELFKV